MKKRLLILLIILAVPGILLASSQNKKNVFPKIDSVGPEMFTHIGYILNMHQRDNDKSNAYLIEIAINDYKSKHMKTFYNYSRNAQLKGEALQRLYTLEQNETTSDKRLLWSYEHQVNNAINGIYAHEHEDVVPVHASLNESVKTENPIKLYFDIIRNAPNNKSQTTIRSMQMRDIMAPLRKILSSPYFWSFCALSYLAVKCVQHMEKQSNQEKEASTDPDTQAEQASDLSLPPTVAQQQVKR
jgi:hypothetical protein